MKNKSKISLIIFVALVVLGIIGAPLYFGGDETKRKPPLFIIAEIFRIYGQSIKFHGIVLDQFGNPVPNARIDYTLMDVGNFFSALALKDTEREYTLSDADGRFYISGAGGSLTCFVSHPDYYRTQESSHSRDYSPDEKKFSRNDSKNPFIFRLHKKGICEPLYYSCGEMLNKGKTRTRIENGESIVIDLARAKRQATDTSICISYEHDKKEDVRRGYRWEYTLRIPGGGFIEKRKELDFIAPERGYQEEVKITCPADYEPWHWQQKKFYFVKFPNGLYGTFEIHAEPGSDGSFRFQALINPNPASRNLEYEHEKQINKNSRGDKYHSRL